MSQSEVDKVVALIKRDPMRTEALNWVYKLKLPQCYIAAGFVRNLVWDSLHNITPATPLNDADVIYFDPTESDIDACAKYEAQLSHSMPQLRWQVRNQATMHIRNGDEPYKSTVHAMSYWPEKETAVAVRQTSVNQYQVAAAFGLECLFNFSITHNPKRSRAIFDHRVNCKGWLSRWPSLNVAI
ncbi:MAG: nucleotidyltransferase family protein [Alteromonadaceae bacterium]|nr:nucleotidyltransferase family protein [Alteromonadaceae bacterium]